VAYSEAAAQAGGKSGRSIPGLGTRVKFYPSERSRLARIGCECTDMADDRMLYELLLNPRQFQGIKMMVQPTAFEDLGVDNSVLANKIISG
jgi:hypothetical protein